MAFDQSALLDRLGLQETSIAESIHTGAELPGSWLAGSWLAGSWPRFSAGESAPADTDGDPDVRPRAAQGDVPLRAAQERKHDAGEAQDENEATC